MVCVSLGGTSLTSFDIGKVREPCAVIFLNWTHVLDCCMARLVDKNGHTKDM